MSYIATIRESLNNRISELESELAPLREAVSHLTEDDTTPPDTSGDDSPSTSKKSTGKKRGRRSSSEVRSERLTKNRNARLRANGNSDEDDEPARTTRVYGTRADEIMELTDQGLSAKEIAEELGTHPNYVYLVRRRELKSVS